MPRKKAVAKKKPEPKSKGGLCRKNWCMAEASRLNRLREAHKLQSSLLLQCRTRADKYKTALVKIESEYQASREEHAAARARVDADRERRYSEGFAKGYAKASHQERAAANVTLLEQRYLEGVRVGKARAYEAMKLVDFCRLIRARLG